MQTQQIDSLYAWYRLAVSVAASTVATVGLWSVVLVMPSVQADFGVDRAATSIAYTGAMIGFGFGNVILGRLVDRFGIAPILAIAGVLQSAAFAVSTLVDSIWAFALLQIAVGFAASAGFGPLIADVSHWFLRRRGLAVAIAACGNYLAGALWPLLLKDTLTEHGWQAAFLMIAAICAASILPMAAMLVRRAPQVTEPGTVAAFNTRQIDLSPAKIQILLAAAGVCCCVAMAMPQVHIVAYCSDLGYGVAAGAQMLSVMLAAGVVSRVLSGMVADWIGGLRTLLIGSVLQCLALFFYIPFNGLASLYVVSLIFGLSQGGIVPSYAIIVREYLPAAEAGRRVGIVIMATVVGMALGGFLSGWIYDLTGSYRAAFLNGIAWNFVNIAIALFLLMRGMRRVAAPAYA
jgi:MFS family permease